MTSLIESLKRSRSPSEEPVTSSKGSAKVKKEVKEEEEDDEDDEEPIVKRPRRQESKAEKKPEKKAEKKPEKKPEKASKGKASTAKQPTKEKPSKSVKAEPKVKQEVLKEEDDDEVSEREANESASEVDEDQEDEDEKPEVAAKAREKIQTTLKSAGKDPYPDWKPGEPVPYAALCTTFSLIEMTTKRLIIASHCSLFLRQVMRLTPDDLLSTVLLMINKLAADYAGIELGIGESLIMKAIGETTGRSLQVIKQDQKEIGDLGLVAVKSRSKQPTMFKPKALTIRGVHKGLMDIATTSGHGAQGRKVDLIKKLLSAADAHATSKIDIDKDKGGPSEAKFIVRFLEGKLRLGLAEKTVLTSLSQAMVFHEIELKGSGKIPSTDQLAKGESILKSVHR